MVIILRRTQKALLCIIMLAAGIGLLCCLHQDTREETSPGLEVLPYGDYLKWKEAQQYFPRYGYAVVVDVETGLAFQVQRRGGTYHADVQPLTVVDTQIMKILYQGRWSWNRRSVVVITDNGKRIAASMNGMPHGQGQIQGNAFNGHFCIHFRDSKVHCSNRVDLAHQVMIWKAAGVLEKQLAGMPPEEIIRVFFVALDNQECKLALRLVQPGSSKTEITEIINNVYSVQVDAIAPSSEINTYVAGVRIVYESDLSNPIKRRFIVRVGKTTGGYQIEQIKSFSN